MADFARRAVVRRAVLYVVSGLAAACGSERTGPPPVQESSPEPAGLIVRISRGQSFSASCVLVERNSTVEWRNLTPHIGLGVLSLREPYELSSPALLAPYNWVPPERSEECARRAGGVCQEAAPYSFWRHTFRDLGVFDYRDASGSTATANSAYAYGLPAGTTTSSSVVTGTVCVRSGLSGTECAQVCCTQQSDCAEGIACIGGRCGGTP